MKPIVIAPVILALAGCASSEFSAVKSLPEKPAVSASKVRAMMLGEWCGEIKLNDGTLQQWTINRLEDGTYKSAFLVTRADGKTESWGEFGLWGVRQPVYFTATRGFFENGQGIPADTSQPDLYDAYSITELSQDRFSYVSYASGSKFTVTRQCNL